MAFGKLDQILSASEIFGLVQRSRLVEKEIGLESVASVDAVSKIAQYLQSSGGKRLRPSLLLLCARLVGEAGPKRDPSCGSGGDASFRHAGA